MGNIKIQLALVREVVHRREKAQDNRVLSDGEQSLRREL